LRQEAVVLLEREPIESNLLHLARNQVDGAGLELLVSSIASGIGQLEKENELLRERTAHLEAALRQRDERAAQLEATIVAKAEAARTTLHRVAQSLLRAEEAVEPAQKGTDHPGASRYLDAAKRVVELQKDVIGMLERAQDELTRQNQDSDDRATAILRDARLSILSLADEVAPQTQDNPLCGNAR
jgi:cell division septum initiation protein DivIVA